MSQSSHVGPRPRPTGSQPKTASLRDCLDQHYSALIEIAQVAKATPANAAPALQFTARAAARLCHASTARVLILDDRELRLAALFPPTQDPTRQGDWLALAEDLARQAIESGRPIQARTNVLQADGNTVDNARNVLAMPIIIADKAVGVILVARSRRISYGNDEIRVVGAMADQCASALTTARLVRESQSHDTELAQAKARQVASDEVLELIRASGTNISCVLDTVVSRAARLCHAEWGIIRQRRPDGLYPPVATYSIQPDVLTFISENPIAPGRASAASRALLERRTIHVPDILADPDYTWGKEEKGFGHRSVLAVPLLRGNEALGVFSLVRNAVQAFSADEIALVTSFAAKALIAIENAELIAQVNARTEELHESLSYQTAIAEVLNVINRSPSDLQPVLDCIVETAVRLCSADFAFIFQLESDGRYHLAAADRSRRDLIEFLTAHPPAPGDGSLTGRVALERRTVHVPDANSDPDYRWPEWLALSGFRTFLSVPFLRDGVVTGVISLGRVKVQPFSARQIEVVSTFADQAMIAIENVGLFKQVQARTRELQSSLDYQTALSGVLSVLSRSPSSLEPVLETIAQTARRLCDCHDAVILLRDGDLLRPVAHCGPIGFNPTERPVGSDWISGRSVLELRAIHVSNVSQAEDFPESRELARQFGQNTVLAIP